MTSIERRMVQNELELRQAPDGSAIIEGYAAVFNSLSKPMGRFVETVIPGAFKKTIQEADVRALINHDKNLVLGRTRSGTLKLAEDRNGLHYEVVAPNTSYARDLAESVARGDVNESSFGFAVVGVNGERWNQTNSGTPLRELHEVRLFDVSPVTVPAYEATTVVFSKRSLESLCELRGIDPEQFADVDLDSAVATLIDNAEPPTAEPTQEAQEASEGAENEAEQEAPAQLQVYRKRLELMRKPA